MMSIRKLMRGKKRLRKVAKQCTNYGRRVQNSVFECILDNAQCIVLKSILADIIDEEKDSLRFYYLGNNYKTKVEHIGVERGTAIDQVLIFRCESVVHRKSPGDSHLKCTKGAGIEKMGKKRMEREGGER